MGTELNREGDGPDGNEETQPGHADHSHVWDFNQKEGLIPRSLLRNKLFQDMEEVIY